MENSLTAHGQQDFTPAARARFLSFVLQRKCPTIQQHRKNNQRVVRNLCCFGNTQRAVPKPYQNNSCNIQERYSPHPTEFEKKTRRQ